MIAAFLVGSRRLRFHSDSAWMQYICGWVSAAGNRRLGTDVTQGGSPHDDNECQTRPGTKDLLASQLSERMTLSPFVQLNFKYVITIPNCDCSSDLILLHCAEMALDLW